MSQVLARRYRPQTFEDVIGQGPVVQTLRNAITSGRVAHGFIFSGHRGIGKTTVARILAKALNCRQSEGPTPTPCGVCDACVEIRDGRSVDVIEIDAASNRGIDEIRTLRDNVRYRPSRDRYKFYILDEAHQLTDDAFNALLKTLEEPPEWAVFVLATTEPEALPATIRSRCQHFGFRAVPFGQIVERLRYICSAETIPAQDEALGLIAEAGEGSIRDALSLLDQAISHAGGELTAETVQALLGRVSSRRVLELMQAVAEGSSQRVLELTDALLNTGVAPAQLCRQVVHFVRNLLVAQSAGRDSALLEVTDQERLTLSEAAATFTEEDLARFLQILLRTAGDLRHAREERLHLELGLLKLVHARRLTRVEDVLAALEGNRGAGDDTLRSTPASTAPLLRAPAVAPVNAPTATPPLSAAPTAAKPSPLAEALKKKSNSVPPVLAPPPAVIQAMAPAAVEVAPAASGEPAGMAPEPAGVSPSPVAATTAVLDALRQDQRGAVLSMVEKADWEWSPGRLQLTFGGAHAPLGGLVDTEDIRKTLRNVARSVLGQAPEIVIRRVEVETGGATARPLATLSGSPEDRAARHPLVRALREQLEVHVLRTGAWPR